MSDQPGPWGPVSQPDATGGAAPPEGAPAAPSHWVGTQDSNASPGYPPPGGAGFTEPGYQPGPGPGYSPPGGFAPPGGPGYPPPGGTGYQGGPWPGGYGGPPYQVRPPFSALAIVGFVLSLLWLFGAGSLAGLILGIISLRSMAKRLQRGRGLAIAAIVISVLGLLLTGLMIILVAAGTPTTNNSSGGPASASSDFSPCTSAQTVPYPVLVKNPAAMSGTCVTYTAQVFQFDSVTGPTHLLVYVTNEGYGVWDNIVEVHLSDAFAGHGIYENDIVTLTGRVEGSDTYTTTANGSNTVPVIDATAVQLTSGS